METVDTGTHEPRARRLRDALAWAAVALLTVALMAVTTRQALDQYRALRTGWSWDLAYYNQWYWTLLRGDGTISVRPFAAYADEGPSVWKTNYLAPVRLMLVPVYAAAPGPETLLIVHNLVIWLVVPAAFTLVRAETRSSALGLAGAGLVPLTPLLWPLVWNDFRELQMALPFVLWAVQGVRGRQVGVAALGIAGMLACRQEMAVMVMTFAFLPARAPEPEDVGRSYRWAHVLIVVGLAWMLFGFFGYLRYTSSRSSVLQYVDQFLGPKAPIGATLETSAEFLVIGLGAWTVFLLAAPRVALLVLPWLWSLAGGRWAMRYLATEQWHHVRYASPFVAIGLAAGLVGFGRLSMWLLRRRGGRWWVAAVWLAAAGASSLALVEVKHRTDRQPHPIAPEEARAVWHWIGEVGPDETVLAVYDVTAPLSSRQRLYSYILDMNKPRGYPWLRPEFTWVFYRNSDPDLQAFEPQGFQVVHRGPYLTIFHRPSQAETGRR
jgi:hypothetical protein